MNKRNIISIVFVVISLVLAVVGYFILPEQVVIQFSIDSPNSTAPKLLALLIPTVLGAGGAVAPLFFKEDERVLRKSYLVSVIGIGLGVFMIAVNSFV